MFKKIFNFIKKNFLTIYIIINVLYINFFNYLIVIPRVTNYYTYSKSLISLLIINIIIIIFYFIFNRKKIKLNLYDIFILLIVIFSIISTVFAISQKMALFGCNYRPEGLFSILYYLSIFYISTFIKNKKDKKMIAYSIILTGLIQSIYAILQITCSPLVKTITYKDQVWAVGFTQNPNFLGSYTLMSLLYTYGLLFEEVKKERKIIIALISIIILYGLIASNTLSCIVGLFVAFIIIAIFSIKNKKYKELIFITISIPSMLFMVDKIGSTTLVKDIIKTKNETVEMSKGHFEKNYGTKRMWIWSETLKIVPNHLLHGAGIDNFILAFNGGSLRNGSKIYIKAHNEYLQILVTEGIFCLLSYLALYTNIVYKGIKRSFKNKELFIILPAVGYLIQATFNISVLEVAPIFFISLGLLTERVDKNGKSKHNNTCS